MMKKILSVLLFAYATLPMKAQRLLSLDSCRALALRNNKQLNISKLNRDVARNARKAMRTKYLPKMDAVGAYQFTSREISILNNRQRCIEQFRHQCRDQNRQ